MQGDPTQKLEKILGLYHEIDIRGMRLVNILLRECVEHKIKLDPKFLDYVQEYTEICDELHKMAINGKSSAL